LIGVSHACIYVDDARPSMILALILHAAASSKDREMHVPRDHISLSDHSRLSPSKKSADDSQAFKYFLSRIAGYSIRPPTFLPSEMASL
jgi:hypothetical protein